MKVGDMVKLKSDTSSNFEIAFIEIPDILGGFKLDRPIGGFRYWNKDDMTFVAQSESRIRAKNVNNR